MLHKKNILVGITQKFAGLDLSPNALPNEDMGELYEALVRKWADSIKADAGEFFTPRDIVHLLADLVFAPDAQRLKGEGVIKTAYDPTIGTGGLVTVMESYARSKNPKLRLNLYGQELKDLSYAVCAADMLIKHASADANAQFEVRHGNTLTNDLFPGRTFDYVAANPPYGAPWGGKDRKHDEEAIRAQTERFAGGFPQTGDSALLFVQHIVNKMKPTAEGGARAGIVLAGSPLFNGDAGSGESEIRRWLIEQDLIEAIVALPTELFFDTGTALRVFEDINHKGEDLLQADLMKSAFMKMCKSEHEWAAVDADWNAIMENASARKNGDDGFIRKALMAMVWEPIGSPKEAPKARELLKGITDYCKRKNESSRSVLEKIATFSRALGKFGESQGLYADGYSTPALVRLRRIPSTAEFVSTMVCCMPTALSLESREKLCLLIEAAAAVIGLTKASKNINYIVQRWYVEMRGLTEDTVDTFVSGFFSAIIENKLEDFESAFYGMRIGPARGKASDAKWAKHFLAILEDYLRVGLGVQRVSYEAGSKAPVVAAHLEHILPQAAAARQELPEDVVYSIGNCTLLEPGKNKSIQDASYAAKLPIYQRSDFRVTSELSPGYHGVSTRERKFLDQPDIAAIVGYSVFKQADVQRRAEGMFRLLCAIWGLPLKGTAMRGTPGLAAADPQTVSAVWATSSVSRRAFSTEAFGAAVSESKGVAGTASPKAAEPPIEWADEAGINSTVVLSYGGVRYSVQLLAAEVAASSRAGLNVRKGVGRELLGKKVGDTLRDSLFGGPVDVITVLAVS